MSCLQDRLNDALVAGEPLTADGQFGPQTAAAVSALQSHLGLTVDGVAGRQTAEALTIWEEPEYEIQAAASNCHPSYTPCLPNVGDLNCGSDDLPTVQVIGPDSYDLDADSDGVGCD